MHLALVPRRRLASRYGTAAPAVFAALAEALAARAAAGFPTTVYDPEAGLPELALPPAPLTATALVTQIGAVAEALGAQGAIIESLWIVGGPQVTPFASLTNPMRDSDGALRGDAPYALATATAPLAHWPVGRTPDADPEQPGLLAAQLRRVAAAHCAGHRGPRPMVAVSAARWAAVTEEVLAGLQAPEPLCAPPLSAGPAAAAVLRGARLIYCNLHGVRDREAWYGQPADDTALPPALAPADLISLALDGAVVVSQACFGARLAPVSAGPTLATALLTAGASGIFAALDLTYGAPDPPAGESDLLAQALLTALHAPGARLGGAFVAAQHATLRESIRRQGNLAPDDLKTLLGFTLYGDPLLPM